MKTYWPCLCPGGFSNQPSPLPSPMMLKPPFPSLQNVGLYHRFRVFTERRLYARHFTKGRDPNSGTAQLWS